MLKRQKAIFRTLLKLAKKRNIHVELKSPLPGQINGIWWRHNDFEYILLNEKLKNPDKLNFVFAHELGHSILHKGTLSMHFIRKTIGITTTESL